jgi:NADH-quinone oxidoreductase subunit K
MVPLSWYLILSGILFSLGVLGFLLKRNIITIFMSIELMLNAVNLSFVAFANYWHTHPAVLANGDPVIPLSGQVFVFFVMVVAAAEAAVGLAIIISVYRTRETLNVDRVNLLKL